jgi:hypothetical protein
MGKPPASGERLPQDCSPEGEWNQVAACTRSPPAYAGRRIARPTRLLSGLRLRPLPYLMVRPWAARSLCALRFSRAEGRSGGTARSGPSHADASREPSAQADSHQAITILPRGSSEICTRDHGLL